MSVLRLGCKASFLCPALEFFMIGSAVSRSQPSLNRVKAFEAGARHESFTRAAEELCVTQGAVSHQPKALEAEFGDHQPRAAAADLLS